MNERESLFSVADARAAIARERESRHWTNFQRKMYLGDDWPSVTARITREADAAVDWLSGVVGQLRSAWNAHFESCPAPMLNIPPPTWGQIREWQDAPSGTFSVNTPADEGEQRG